MKKSVYIKFWGVRGSTPSISRNTVKYGGNTPCVEIRSGNTLIICDAGTGIRALGEHLLKSGAKVEALILMSHIHWDHISGLPFFLPLYRREARLKICGPDLGRTNFKKSLKAAISEPFFPVSLENAPSRIELKGLKEKKFVYEAVKITPFKLNHPGGAFGWQFHFPGGRKLIYVSDNEPGKNRGALVKWARGADVMIHDAQYSPEEYKKHIGWGHSPYNYPIEIAADAGVGRLVLSHFDPSHSDKDLDGILLKAKGLAKKMGKGLKCELAFEGSSIAI